MKELIREWKVIPHFHQIADTGDYDGCYELTNGEVSIFTTDDIEADDDIIKSLNEGGFNFYLSREQEDINYGLSLEIEELKKEIEALEQVSKEKCRDFYNVGMNKAIALSLSAKGVPAEYTPDFETYCKTLNDNKL